MNNQKKINYVINLLYFLYFVILIAERSISVILSIANGVGLFSGGYNIFVYSTIILSFVGFLIYLLIKCRSNIKALFKPAEDIDFKDLIIASGIILLAGMVHSEYTVSGIQFASYGLLIVGIILKVVMMSKAAKSKPLLWLSVSYLIAYSMAIPVTYPSLLNYAGLFVALEGITSYLLVGTFTLMTLKLFKGDENLFVLPCFLLALVLDAVLIIMRWQEEINYFVLIFIGLSLVLFVIGSIIVNYESKKKEDTAVAKL